MCVCNFKIFFEKLKKKYISQELWPYMEERMEGGCDKDSFINGKDF